MFASRGEMLLALATIPMCFQMPGRLLVSRNADDLFHLIERLLKRLSPSGGEPVLGARNASLEKLTAGDVVALLELARVNA